MDVTKETQTNEFCLLSQLKKKKKNLIFNYYYLKKKIIVEDFRRLAFDSGRLLFWKTC